MHGMPGNKSRSGSEVAAVSLSPGELATCAAERRSAGTIVAVEVTAVGSPADSPAFTKLHGALEGDTSGITAAEMGKPGAKCTVTWRLCLRLGVSSLHLRSVAGSGAVS